MGNTIGALCVIDSAGSCNTRGGCLTFLVKITPTVSSELNPHQGASSAASTGRGRK